MYVNLCNKTKVGFAFQENNLIYRKSVLGQLVLTSLLHITRIITCVILRKSYCDELCIL